MPTQKPRFTITMDEDLYQKINAFRSKHHYKNQNQAVLALIAAGLAESEKGAQKTAPSIPDEAENTAKNYRSLDAWGKKAVDAIIEVERKRCSISLAEKYADYQNPNIRSLDVAARNGIPISLQDMEVNVISDDDMHSRSR